MAAHAHDQAIIESVRTALIAGATFGEISSRLGFTRAVVGGIVARNQMKGLSQHRDVAKPKSEAKPERTRKFWPGNPFAKPGSQLRNLKCESSPRAVSWNDFEPSCQCHWPIDSAPLLFCGRARLAKPAIGKQSPYCRGHHARAYPKNRAANSGRDSMEV
jgi:hypothetical protein